MSGPPKSTQPWFISITARWIDAEGLEALRTSLENTLKDRSLPYYHRIIPEPSRHSTVFALAELSAFPPIGPADVYAEGVLQELATTSGVRGQVRGAFKPFRARADTIRCFDDGTTVQFCDNEDVAAMRRAFGRILGPALEAIGHDRAGFRPMVTDPNKSTGPRFFGSIARSVRPSDGRQLRWEAPVTDRPELTFNRIYLLVSDDALTNRLSSGSLLLGE